MRDALYLNGVFDSVLQEIVAVQDAVPEQILFLQPYSGSRISMLAKPTVGPTQDDPVRLYLSITEDLNHVHYCGEIVGWEDKGKISSPRKAVFNRLIKEFQPEEREIYDKGVNLLIVRGIKKVESPFPVGELMVRSTMAPLGERTTAGGWAFVLPDRVATA